MSEICSTNGRDEKYIQNINDDNTNNMYLLLQAIKKSDSPTIRTYDRLCMSPARKAMSFTAPSCLFTNLHYLNMTFATHDL